MNNLESNKFIVKFMTKKIESGHYEMETPIGTWTIKKEYYSIFRNGYSNWHGKRIGSGWVVEDENGKNIGCGDFETKRSVIEYLLPENFCFICKRSIKYRYCKCKGGNNVR